MGFTFEIPDIHVGGGEKKSLREGGHVLGA